MFSRAGHCPPHAISRRAALAGGAALAAAATVRGTVAGQPATPVADGGVPESIAEVMGRPVFPNFTRWGIHVADEASGEALLDLNGDDRFVPGSTTKLFPASASLVAYGPDFRFETPVYAQGTLADGTLDGDLILVASGDLTMGGRDLPDGTMAHGNIDHTDANAVPGFAVLTETNPLAGLDALAQQVAAAGVKRAKDVIVDARLWAQMAKDDYVLSPIMINDNVVDLTITPGKAGEPATLVSRPETAFYAIAVDVATAAAGTPLAIASTTPPMGDVTVSGSIAADSAPMVQTFQVEDPPAFARALFIEALNRAGVAVDAPVRASNPADRLPAAGSYADADRVARFTSLPLSEAVKVVMKVSLNQGADTLVFLLAVKSGTPTFDAGLAAIGDFLPTVGVDRKAVSLGDGRGNEPADLFSPRSACDLVRGMAARPEGPALRASLPILGVDGTEWQSIPKSSPALGKIVAKSGTTATGDLVNQRLLLLGKADAGYMTAASGRDLVWAAYVNDVPVADISGVLEVSAAIGGIAEAIFNEF